MAKMMTKATMMKGNEDGNENGDESGSTEVPIRTAPVCGHLSDQVPSSQEKG